MNLSQIQAECARLLSDNGNNRWSTDVLTTRANLAQVEIQGYTNAVKTPESLTPVTSQRTLILNAATMDIIRATKTLADGSIRPFNGITREQLDFLYPDWQQWQDDEPLFWYYDATNQNINLVPKPAAQFAVVNGLTLWESRKPADLVNSTDIPFDSNNQMVPYHMAIVHWVVAQCFQDDGTQEALAKAHFHKSGNMLSPGEYEKEVGRILSEFDVPEAIPGQVLFRPQGGRIGWAWLPTKGNPLPF